MLARACLLAVALVVAACNGPAGRGNSDGGALTAPPGCHAYPYGSVLVVSGSPAGQTGMASQFVPSGGGACTDATMGTCVVTTTAMGTPPAQVGAGTITAGGGETTLMQMPQTSASGTTYPSVTSVQSLWRGGGEPVPVSAAGGDVPAFATTLTSPTAATLTGPDFTGGGASVSRQKDLMVTWSGDGSGTADVELLGTGGDTVYIHCRYPLSAHAGVVPAALLGKLPATASGGLVMTSNSEQLLMAGGWSVDVRLQTGAVDGRGALATYNVSFQ